MLGAIPSVFDQSVTWIEPELTWLRAADEARVPVLGICYGAQELRTIFGGRVVAAAQKEVGWKMIETVRPDLIPAGPWLLFHGDRREPPPQAAILARNEVGVQAFSVGRHLAVQFHPEVDGAQLGQWLDAGGRRRRSALASILTRSLPGRSRRSPLRGRVLTAWSRRRCGWRRPRRWLAFWPASYCSLADLLLLG